MVDNILSSIILDVYFVYLLTTFPGDKLRLRENAEREDNDLSKTTKKSNLYCIERHKAITCKFCYIVHVSNSSCSHS